LVGQAWHEAAKGSDVEQEVWPKSLASIGF